VSAYVPRDPRCKHCEWGPTVHGAAGSCPQPKNWADRASLDYRDGRGPRYILAPSDPLRLEVWDVAENEIAHQGVTWYEARAWMEEKNGRAKRTNILCAAHRCGEVKCSGASYPCWIDNDARLEMLKR
jgi:hypothetical protein